MFSLGDWQTAAGACSSVADRKKPICIAFTSERTSSSSVAQKHLSRDMIFYSLDPQFTALLFSVYTRSERIGCSILPDALCFSPVVPLSSNFLTYAQSVGWQLISIGEQYANFFSQVRVGSVIFLVGVGSLVCWKLWDYWSHGGSMDPSQGPSDGGQQPPKEKVFTKTPSKRTKDFIASFLEEEFVQDFEDMEEEDPASIQGKYFGPDSPPGDAHVKKSRRICALSSSECSPRSLSETTRQYLADQSNSCDQEDVGFQTSDFEQYDSLPYDDVNPTPSVQNQCKRFKKRHKPHNKDRSLSSSPSRSPFHLQFSKNDYHGQGKSNVWGSHLNEGFSSNEASPRGLRQDKSSTLHTARMGRRRQGDGSETPDSEEVQKPNRLNLNHIHKPAAFLKSPQYANFNSDDEDWINDGRMQPEGEEEYSDNQISRRRLSREISVSDLLGRMRKRMSLSRDDSVSSRLSDILKRDDSICSNLSEYAMSDCSEFSLELSFKDDSIANQTITHFADIENELNTLKSSVYEMDEEFVRFTSRPNPYLLKTTFSDYSLDSQESRPNSALEVVHHQKSLKRRYPSGQYRESFDFAEGEEEQYFVGRRSDSRRGSSTLESLSSSCKNVPPSKVNFDLSCSYEESSEGMNYASLERRAAWMRNQGEIPPAVAYRKAKSFTKQNSNASLRRTVTQDEILNSLEWDNDCLKQYKDERNENNSDVTISEVESIQKMEGFDECKKEFRRSQYLPNHCSLELDLESELRESPSAIAFSGREAIVSSLSPALRRFLHLEDDIVKPSGAEKSPVGANSSQRDSMTLSMGSGGMTTSIDSAFHSIGGSRSGSSSPVLTQSMMSSGICCSLSEIPESDNATKRRSFEENKINRRSWTSSEDKTSIDNESSLCLESSITSLSPVREIREKEFTQDSRNLNEEYENANLYNNNGNLEESNIIRNNDNETEEGCLNQNNIMGNLHGTRASESNSDSSSGLQSTTPANNTVKTVNDKIEILSYAQQEWRSNTQKAKTIRQGYAAIVEELELNHLRIVRGDNYCGIRATTFQILSQGIATPSGYQVLNRLLSEINNGANWIKEYNFGNRIQVHEDQVINQFRICLEALDKMAMELSGCENKESVLLSALNSDPLVDIHLCEAVKLHMLVAAMELFKKELEGEQVPLFGMIMFARRSCSNPKEFLLHHLNPVGDSAGLEQDLQKIEMFLLGYALGVTVQVVRPSCYGKEDFICFYPDENIGVWPEVTLVAEDDRHYNVLVK